VEQWNSAPIELNQLRYDISKPIDMYAANLKVSGVFTSFVASLWCIYFFRISVRFMLFGHDAKMSRKTLLQPPLAGVRKTNADFRRHKNCLYVFRFISNTP